MDSHCPSLPETHQPGSFAEAWGHCYWPGVTSSWNSYWLRLYHSGCPSPGDVPCVVDRVSSRLTAHPAKVKICQKRSLTFAHSLISEPPVYPLIHHLCVVHPCIVLCCSAMYLSFDGSSIYLLASPTCHPSFKQSPTTLTEGAQSSRHGFCGSLVAAPCLEL